MPSRCRQPSASSNSNSWTPRKSRRWRRASVFHRLISRQFAAALGQTSAAYGRRIRLDHAVNRMLFDPVPLGKISRVFGFANQAAFNRAFRRQHGVSPSEFLHRLRGHPPRTAAPPAGLPVRIVDRPAEPALARRFFGPDLAGHWRRFVADLPPHFASSRRRAGLLYDLPAVTPAGHQRYDCAIAIDATRPSIFAEAARGGLDAIELPGGPHAEVPGCATTEDVGSAIGFLYGVWLRSQTRFAPEGDPMVHWCGEDDSAGFTATIRLRRLVDSPVSNLMPLDPGLRPMGRR